MLGRHHLMRTGFITGALWLGRAQREEIAHRAAVEEVVELLELEPHRHTPAGLLPYGVQKRLELGRALAMEPKLLLLDEPVAGMNLEETEDMARYLIEVRERLDLAMILVEHEMRLVMDLADRVLALDFGTPLATGTPAEVQAEPAVVEAYLGAGRVSIAARAPARPRPRAARTRSRCARSTAAAGGRSPGPATPSAWPRVARGPAAARRRARRPRRDPRREPAGVGDRRPRGAGHRRDQRRRLPDEPGRRGRVPARALRSVVLVAEDEEQLDKALAVRERLPGAAPDRGDRPAQRPRARRPDRS